MCITGTFFTKKKTPNFFSPAARSVEMCIIGTFLTQPSPIFFRLRRAVWKYTSGWHLWGKQKLKLQQKKNNTS
jgi:hypothetical protein